MTEPYRSVDDRLDEIARRDPDRYAAIGWVDDVEQSLRWVDFDEMTRQRAVTLRALAGDGAILALPVGTDVASAVDIVACLRAAVAFVPVNVRTPQAERDAVLAHCADRQGRAVRTLAGLTVQPAAGVAARRTGADLAYLLLTGGSSGLPKPIPFRGPVIYHPHRYPNPLLRRANFREGQRQLLVAPLHHAAAFSCFLEGVLSGGTTILQPAFHGELMWRLVGEYAVEWMMLTPTHMRAALQPAPVPAATASLVAMLHTGAPCDPDLKRSWIDLLGPDRIFEMYGSAEGVGVTLIRGDEWLDHPGSVGRGVWTQIRILDERLRPVPQTGTGEVFMRTPAPRDPAGTREAAGTRGSVVHARRTADGFIGIGDHGWLDADGFLHLAGRADDLIIVGGENVYPAEIEAVLRTHPDVLDVAVVARPDPVLGQRPHAVVVPRAGRSVSMTDLRRYCAERIASYKIPARFEFQAELPRTTTGKLQRWRLSGDDAAGGTGDPASGGPS